MRTQRIFTRRQDGWGKMGGGDKNQMVSCIVAKESILLILIHSLIRLWSFQQYLINFSKKCALSEFFPEGRTVGGKMGGGDKNQMVSCIVAKESILLFLIHLLIRLRSSWQYLINFSKKCGLCEFVLEGRTVGGQNGWWLQKVGGILHCCSRVDFSVSHSFAHKILFFLVVSY